MEKYDFAAVDVAFTTWVNEAMASGLGCVWDKRDVGVVEGSTKSSKYSSIRTNDQLTCQNKYQNI